MITMTGKYQTRDGRAVRILATDLKAGATCVLGLIAVADDEEMVGVWAADGRAFPWLKDNPEDLIPAPTKHEEGWMAIGNNGLQERKEVYADRDLAERIATAFKQHVVHVTWEDS